MDTLFGSAAREHASVEQDFRGSPQPRSKKASSLEEVAAQIVENNFKRVVVLTGAGISTACGIPDFRSPGTGLYHTLHEKYPDVIGSSKGTANGDGKSVERAFSLEFFKEDRGKLFALIKQDFLKKSETVQPSQAHKFLKHLQDLGCLLRCYTQNIDGLERRAGVEEERLVTCHGDEAAGYCIDCGGEWKDGEKWKKLTMETGLPVPCDKCEKGVIKPGIVLYGEPLTKRYRTLVTDNILNTDFDVCDLLVVIGTSLRVPPFNMLPEMVDERCPRVLINNEKTEKPKIAGFDGFDFESEGTRDLFLQGDCERICADLNERFRAGRAGGACT